MKPMISVIIPAYNVEEYIEKAVRSIEAQTFTDWEMFLVDDGSKDGTGAVCDALAAEDSRICVIHQQNQGAPAARNNGIDRACGKYFYFMDGDDWAEPGMLADMVSLAEGWADACIAAPGEESGNFGAPESRCAQLVVMGYYIETYYSDTEFYLQKQSVSSVTYGSRAEFRAAAHELFDKNLLYTPWNKLYLASYIKGNGLYFPKTHWDDFPFNLSVLRNVERVRVSENAYYHFLRKRAESESEKYNPALFEKREEENGWLKGLYDDWREDEASGTDLAACVFSDAAREFISRRYLERIIGCVENVTNQACTLSPKEKRGQIKMILNHPEVREALKIAKPRSGYMKLMLVPVRLKLAGLTMLEGRVITSVRKKNIKRFAKLKANR